MVVSPFFGLRCMYEVCRKVKMDMRNKSTKRRLCYIYIVDLCLGHFVPQCLHVLAINKSSQPPPDNPRPTCHCGGYSK